MERIEPAQSKGIHRNALRTWGMLFAAAGVASRSLLQNGLLNMTEASGAQLLEAMQSSDLAMVYATIALVFQALETCAVPIFAFLLAEGAWHTADMSRYLARVGAVAILSEIPYNLAMSGRLLDLSSRNPVFGLVLALVMLCLHKQYLDKGFKGVLIRVVVTVCAMLWCRMLSIGYGASTCFIVAVVWSLWRKPMLRNMAGAMAALLCSLNSLLFMFAPMGFMAIHFYNGEKGEEKRIVSYLAYPVLLLVMGVAAKFL